MEERLNKELVLGENELDNLDNESQNIDSTETPEPVQTQVLLQDSKEFFSMELPSGYKFTAGSSVLRVDFLTELILRTYEIISESKSKSKSNGYIG